MPGGEGFMSEQALTLRKLHVVWILANNSSAPYFNWFAERTALGNEVHLTFICLYNSEPQMIKDVREFGWTCEWLYFDENHRKTSLFRVLPKLYRLLRRLKPDVAHTHLFDDALSGLLAARLGGVKMRVNTRGDASYHFHYFPQYFKFDLFNNFNSTHIVAISEQSRKFILEKEKAAPAKVSLIHHGIPVERLVEESNLFKNELSEKYHLHGRKVVGTVSRLVEWKGHSYIIEAAEQVVRKYPDVLFLFVGAGSDYEKELLEAVKNRQLNDNVVFTGRVEPQYMPSLYALMDVYVHAAINEPFGFAIVEAMVLGIPVVSTKTGAALDAITHLKSGYLVKDRNHDEIAQGIEYMFENNKTAIGIEGKNIAMEMYDFEKMYGRYVKLYKDYCREH
jgi:glycosyltransferase involved in cell wall biosynthesis